MSGGKAPAAPSGMVWNATLKLVAHLFMKEVVAPTDRRLYFAAVCGAAVYSPQPLHPDDKLCKRCVAIAEKARHPKVKWHVATSPAYTCFATIPNGRLVVWPIAGPPGGWAWIVFDARGDRVAPVACETATTEDEAIAACEKAAIERLRA